MKAIGLLLLFASSAFAQNPHVNLPSACGPKNADFEVRLDRAKHEIPQAEQGKALVYFINEQGSRFVQGGWRFPAVLLGIDGQWVGAYADSSYFSVAAEPGEHRVCALLRGHAGLLITDEVEVARFTAEANKTYYFRTRVISAPDTAYLFLHAVDPDQATYRISLYPLAISHPKE